MPLKHAEGRCGAVQLPARLSAALVPRSRAAVFTRTLDSQGLAAVAGSAGDAEVAEALSDAREAALC
jgi:hypothetical protein